MSSAKKSAFSMFKSRKTKDSSSDLRQSLNSDSTPTSSRSAGNLLSTKELVSDKKRPKNDLKKIKKLLKHGGQSPLIMTDAPLSPISVKNIKSSVELRSLRQKNNLSNSTYQLPLRATPDAAIRSAKKCMETSKPKAEIPLQSRPPLPAPVAAPPALPPRTHHLTNGSTRRKVTRSSSVSILSRDEEGASPISRVLKRRRLSDGAPDEEAGPKSPNQKRIGLRQDKICVLPVEGGRERCEEMPQHPAELDSESPYMHDSRLEAKRLFECLIHPVKSQKFFSELWEKKPLLVKRHMPNYNSGWFSTAELDRILREVTRTFLITRHVFNQENVDFGVNIDVTSYIGGKRETHNPVGRAYATTVWDFYQSGCSVRLLNPQTYSRSVWKLLSILQEYFGSCAGANVYLTPAGTQGFAPHYDDIEAFILQLEGKKHWRLYSPRSEEETLPRTSSGNFTDKDIGEPILDVILEAGDLLYFPRGTIHQGKTMSDVHSLHITFSCCQKNTWGDFLEKLVPQALQSAIEEDLDFRKALPLDYLSYMGVVNSDSENPQRKQFLRKIEQMVTKLLAYTSVDAAVDQMGKRFVQDSLPPVLTDDERRRSIHGAGEHWNAQCGGVRGAVELEPETEVKLIRHGAVRVVTEEDNVCIYHTLENARVYHGKEVQFIEVAADAAPAVEQLIHAYPSHVKVEDLDLNSLQEKLDLATLLYEKGLLVTEEPLEANYDDESDCST